MEESDSSFVSVWHLKSTMPRPIASHNDFIFDVIKLIGGDVHYQGASDFNGV
jgi:hypothetical protein